MTVPARLVTWTSAPACWARSVAAVRSSRCQLCLEYAAFDAVATAPARSACCWYNIWLMSLFVLIEPKKITAATAASATAMNTSARRSPSRLIQYRPALAITGEAEPVAAAENGLHDLRVGRVLLDLAPEVLDVRVD